jgi:hypothetical protein
MTAERPHATIDDPYAAVRESRDSAVAVLQKMTNRFCALMQRSVMRTALPGQHPDHVVHQFMDAVEKETSFRFLIGDEGNAIRNADIILANHQGPQTDDVGGVDEESDIARGTGGTEGLYAHALLSPHTRYVLKNYLVRIPRWTLVKALARLDWHGVKKELGQLFMALAFRKTNPIIVDRTMEKPPREIGASARRNGAYVKRMREVRQDVAQEICRTVNEDGSPVMVYPEGTRSNDGKIQGFVSEYFQSIVTDYVLPRIKDGRPIRIGILVSDVLSAFPDGVGRDVKAYDKPITLRGIEYNPACVVTALEDRTRKVGNAPLSPNEIKIFGRMLLMDVRRQMANALVGILQGGEKA